MHIGKKILCNIQDDPNINSLYIDKDMWDIFKSPLEMQKNNFISMSSLKERQEKSEYIIKWILDTHGKSEVMFFLSQLVTLENRIQELQPWVRDHVVHAVNTFLLGIYILENIDFKNLTHSNKDYSFPWKLSGLTHDLGYPIEISHNIDKQFFDSMNSILHKIDTDVLRIRPHSYYEELNVLSDKQNSYSLIQRRLNKWDLGLNVDSYLEWLHQEVIIDHGVIGALVQLKIIDAMYHKANPARVMRRQILDDLDFNYQFFTTDIIDACSALFIHNISLKYPYINKVDFSKAPLLFLLYLCDTLQEWDRYSEKKAIYSGNEFDIECKNNKISFSCPKPLEGKIYNALHQRLQGLTVLVNGTEAVS
jgi:hypothetical protein